MQGSDEIAASQPFVQKNKGSNTGQAMTFLILDRKNLYSLSQAISFDRG